MRKIQIASLSCIKPNIKEMYKKVKQCHSSNSFMLENIIYFPKMYIYGPGQCGLGGWVLFHAPRGYWFNS